MITPLRKKKKKKKNQQNYSPRAENMYSPRFIQFQFQFSPAQSSPVTVQTKTPEK